MKAQLFPDLVVNGETVSHQIVAAEAQNHQAPRDKPGIAWRKAANAIAIRTLLLQEARKQNLQSTPIDFGAGRSETQEEALIRGLLDQEIDVVPPTEQEIRQEWTRDPSRFRSPPLWDVSHILCACDPSDEADRAKALARAVDIAGQAIGNPKRFSDLARDLSDCGSKTNGGALGQLSPGDSDPAFEAALCDLVEGEITEEPILTRHGWHVILMHAVAEGNVLPFETVRPKIAEAMEKAAWARAAKRYSERLLDEAEITGASLRPV